MKSIDDESNRTFPDLRSLDCLDEDLGRFPHIRPNREVTYDNLQIQGKILENMHT